jgi:predicted amidophosphoribosyltransferase
MPGMAVMICTECKAELPRDAWSCPYCGSPAEEATTGEPGRDISKRGVALMILLFLVFPILLFLIQIFLPDSLP